MASVHVLECRLPAATCPARRAPWPPLQLSSLAVAGATSPLGLLSPPRTLTQFTAGLACQQWGQEPGGSYLPEGL